MGTVFSPCPPAHRPFRGNCEYSLSHSPALAYYRYTPFTQDRNQDMSATYQTVHSAPEIGNTPDVPDAIPRCLVYIGLPDNPQFLGPQDPQALAEHIVKSKGPSGENKDYLYQLEEALNGLSKESEDEHISDLARRCREIEGRGQ